MKYLDATNGGAEVELDAADPKTKWLLAEGYLVKPSEKDETRGIYQTSEPAKNDPTLAENRENPTPVDKLKPHIANPESTGDGEIVHGRHMGLDAALVGNVDQAPKVKVTAHAKAGDFETTEGEGASLKKAIDKEQGQPPLPATGKEPAPVDDASLKDAIDKEQPEVTGPAGA